MPTPVINLDDLEFVSRGHGERFEARFGQIGKRIGARKLGYNLTIVPPGKRAFPHHCHRVNEEMFFILEGQGELRLGDSVHPLRAGDFIACPPSGPEKAHQIINTGDEELRYLAVSTSESPELCEYPDSGKTGIYATFEGEGESIRKRFIAREQATEEDYWAGE